MRIAFLTTVGPAASWGFGGSEDLWIRTAGRFLESGAAVGVGLRQSPALPKAIADLRDRGAAVYEHAPVPSFGRRVLNKLGAPAADPFAWLDAFRPDFVLISQNLFFDGYGMARACRDRGLKFGAVVHIASELFWPGDDVLDDYAAVYGAAAAVWYVSDATRRLAEHQSAVTLPNAGIVRNPYRVPYDADPPWPDDRDGLRLACVGRLEATHKGQDLLIEALAADRWRDRKLSVTLFGGGGQENYLRRLAARHGVGDRVRFGGYAADVERVWATHHGLVLPSRCEGLPLAIVEAMLCGRPAVVTDVGGNTELVRDGETGFVADRPTAGAVAAALERAWDRRAEWPALGRRGREAVRAAVPADPIGLFADEIRRVRAAVPAGPMAAVAGPHSGAP